MVPHAVETLEVCLSIFLIVGVVPETGRLRRERRAADEFRLVAPDLASILIKRTHVHAQPEALNLPCVYRQHGVAEHEATDDVGPAAYARELEILLYLPIDPVEVLDGQWRSRRENRPKSGEVVLCPGFDSAVFARGDELRAGAEDGDTDAFGPIPKMIQSRIARAAFVEGDRRADAQGADEPVPHHPPTSREVEDCVVAGHVGVQHELLHVLKERAASAVDDALGYPGRARRVHDIERVIERDRFEFDSASPVVGPGPRDLPGRAAAKIRPESRVLHIGDVRRLGHESNDDDGLDGGDTLYDGGDALERVDRLSVIRISVGGDQHLGLDLTEAVKHAGDAEIGRTGRPHGADARRREHADDGLGNVRKKPTDAVASLDPDGAHRERQTRNLLIELPIGDRPGSSEFVLSRNRHAIVREPEEMSGEVELHPREPLGRQHSRTAAGLLGGRCRSHFGDVEHLLPEPVAMVHGPTVQRWPIGLKPIAGGHLRHERVHL